ncbi:MAG: hypothetical protein DSZ11_05050, partial [Sulfurovum sp.]
MKKQLVIVSLVLVLTQYLSAECSNSKAFWQSKIAQSASIEQFFLDNYACQKSFYPKLETSQKLYFDTVLYPKNLNKEAYLNRWYAMLFTNDSDFFRKFSFFNNYFTTHREKITTQELNCFQKQKGFANPVPRRAFYGELAKRDMLNDVGYLYPLIRWSYVHNGVDMKLSRARVKKAEKAFGIKKGKVGNKEQFARFIALFEEEYGDVASSLSKKLGISPIKAYKLLVVLTYLESRGNIFAVSTTGAFGPTQLTLHYYMMYGEPSNPFSPKASLIKLSNKFIHYHRIGKSLNSSVIAYKSGSLSKCQNGRNNNDVDCRYYNDYKQYMREMSSFSQKDEISRYLTGKSYFFPEITHLKRTKNQYSLKHYEPYQYAVIKGKILRDRAVESRFLNGQTFKSLGRMKRSEIYELQDKFGANHIGVISDKKVCY